MIETTMLYEIKDFPVTFTEAKNKEINSVIDRFVAAMNRKRQSVSYYVEKRNVEAGKAAEDIFLGKKAEFIALTALIKYFGFLVVNVDLAIREGAAKGWDRDLPFSKVGDYPDVHVKSCSKHTFDCCDDFSWTFQKQNNDGRGGTDDILTEVRKDHLVAMVYMEDPRSKKGVVKAFMPQPEIKQYLKLPKKIELWGLKRCVYYQDLIKTDDE